tara:strand:+ start:659 stop:1036 length:378 start_codon:yes stop_codon:yes gene_type:complete
MLNNGSDHALSRKIVVNSWNTPYAGGKYNGLGARVGPFRRTNNLGDFLNRMGYSCGGPNQVNKSKPGLRIGSIPNMCDGTNIPPSSTNVKFVADSSDYTRFKKLNSKNNELKEGPKKLPLKCVGC